MRKALVSASYNTVSVKPKFLNGSAELTPGGNGCELGGSIQEFWFHRQGVVRRTDQGLSHVVYSLRPGAQFDVHGLHGVGRRHSVAGAAAPRQPEGLRG